MWFLAFTVLSLLYVVAKCELFSSTEDLKAVTEELKFFSLDLSKLIENLQNDLDYVKRKLHDNNRQLEVVDQNPEGFTLNLLGAFKVIKTLASDSSLIKNKLDSSVLDFTKRIANYTPKHSDLMSVVRGLNHLQETYNLSSSDLADGFIQGEKFSESLNAHDLFEIGSELRKQRRFSRSVEYLKLAFSKSAVDTNSDVHGSQILEEIIAASDVKTAVRIADEITHHRSEKTKLKMPKVNLDHFTDKEEEDDNLEVVLTRKVCGGEQTLSDTERSKLHCRFVFSNSFSKLAPFKLEEAHLDPYIVVFHGVINEEEIARLKEMGKPDLYQSATVDENGKEYNEVNTRISRIAWLRDEFDPIVTKISRRIEDMTGLSMETAEALQIQNYGIGGFYKIHYDMLDLRPGQVLEDGNRMSTVMFYLSDVAKGGSTVFPYLKVRIAAEKGAAAFWHNMLPSGLRDYRTRHSGCPVLVGTKWVANKWIREHGQERRRPCNLKFEENNEMQFVEPFLPLFFNGQL